MIDDGGRARLTDFGMSLVSEGTAYGYGSVHGGGAVRWTAPELFDPEEFESQNTRPTARSDMYAFACVCIEVRVHVDVFNVASFAYRNIVSYARENLRFPISQPIKYQCASSEEIGHLDLWFEVAKLFQTVCGC